jgi:hypothetical protein
MSMMPNRVGPSVCRTTGIPPKLTTIASTRANHPAAVENSMDFIAIRTPQEDARGLGRNYANALYDMPVTFSLPASRGRAGTRERAEFFTHRSSARNDIAMRSFDWNKVRTVPGLLCTS